MFKMLTGRVSAALCVVFVLVMLTGSACNTQDVRAETESSLPAEITVTSASVVSIIPDTVTFSLSLTSQDKTADQTQKKNSEAVKKVLEALKANGIDRDGMCTTNYNIYPQYEYADSGETKITGYTASTYLTIKGQKTENIGKIMTDCMAAGANSIDSVTFSCSNYDKAYQQALLQAVKDSKEKAAGLAEAAGKKLGETIAIVEGGASHNQRISTDQDHMGQVTEETSNDNGELILLPGENELTVTATVTYRME